jgi:pyruvate formate lyase activating enzyme
MEVFDKDRVGTVLRIERSSIHDGDGFRTVVFLKGCPLRCQWCSTPEGQSFHIEKTASNVYGSRMTVEEVMREIRKDSLFFFVSSGGVTLSGGEILAQPEFSRALLKNSQEECINTAIETSFFAQWETVRSVLAYVNTAYVDLKMVSADLHKKYCGVDNQLILQNLHATNQLEQQELRLIVHTPIIPGVNNSQEELCKIGEFCTGLKRMDHLQLLPYHRLGSATYQKLGRPYLLDKVVPPTEEELEQYRNTIRKFGITVT